MFVDAVDTSSATKDAKYIAAALVAQIETLGKELIVQVVTTVRQIASLLLNS